MPLIPIRQNLIYQAHHQELFAYIMEKPFNFSSISQKMMWQKVWVHLTSKRSLEVKNMQKQENMLDSVKTK
jgi:hypothetical protein